MARSSRIHCSALLILLIAMVGQTAIPLDDTITPTAQWREHLRPAGMAPDGWEIIPNSITVSPDKRRLAYKIQRGSGKVVVLDGKASPVYLKIGKLTFSGNSKRLYYIARERGPWFISRDNGSKKIIDEVVSDLVVSYTGNKYAVAYKTPTRIRVRINNNHGPIFDAVDMTTFTYSTNTKQQAYYARKGNQWYVQINDQTAGPFDQLAGKPLFDAKSQSMAYMARTNDQWQVIQNNKPWRDSQEVASLQFHPVSNQLFAWLRTDSKQWQLHCNNKPIENAVSDTPCSVTFGNHANQWATVLTQDGKTHLMRNGKRYESQGTILSSSLQFDSKSIQLVYVTRTDQGEHLTIDGNLQQPYQAIQLSDILINRNCKQIVYPAKQNDKWTIIDQGKPIQTVDSIVPGSLAFSPNQKQLVYLAQKGPLKYLYLNHHVVDQFNDITKPVFDKKGHHIAWAAKTANQWHLYIDGQPTPTAFANLVGKPQITVRKNQFHTMILQTNTATATISHLALEKINSNQALATVEPNSIR